MASERNSKETLGRVTITVHFHDQNSNVEYSYSNVQIVEEVGIKLRRAVPWVAPQIEKNGQRRLSIIAWDGCNDFDDFQKIEDER